MYVIIFDLPHQQYVLSKSNSGNVFNILPLKYMEEARGFDSKDRAENYLKRLRSVNSGNGIATLIGNVVRLEE